MRANLYSKVGGHYLMVATIDTLIAKTSLAPAKEVFKSANEVMTSFMFTNLNGPILIYYDILNIANVEKNELRLYNSTNILMGYTSITNRLDTKCPTGKLLWIAPT